MQKMIADEGTSRPAWETLETFARAQVQGFIQRDDHRAAAARAGRGGAVREPAAPALSAPHERKSARCCPRSTCTA